MHVRARFLKWQLVHLRGCQHTPLPTANQCRTQHTIEKRSPARMSHASLSAPKHSTSSCQIGACRATSTRCARTRGRRSRVSLAGGRRCRKGASSVRQTNVGSTSAGEGDRAESDHVANCFVFHTAAQPTRPHSGTHVTDSLRSKAGDIFTCVDVVYR